MVLLYSLVDRFNIAILKFVALGVLTLAALFYVIAGGMWAWDSSHPERQLLPYGAAAAFSLIGVIVDVLAVLLYLKEDGVRSQPVNV